MTQQEIGDAVGNLLDRVDRAQRRRELGAQHVRLGVAGRVVVGGTEGMDPGDLRRQAHDPRWRDRAE